MYMYVLHCTEKEIEPMIYAPTTCAVCKTVI